MKRMRVKARLESQLEQEGPQLKLSSHRAPLNRAITCLS